MPKKKSEWLSVHVEDDGIDVCLRDIDQAWTGILASEVLSIKSDEDAASSSFSLFSTVS